MPSEKSSQIVASKTNDLSQEKGTLPKTSSSPLKMGRFTPQNKSCLPTTNFQVPCSCSEEVYPTDRFSQVEGKDQTDEAMSYTNSTDRYT